MLLYKILFLLILFVIRAQICLSVIAVEVLWKLQTLYLFLEQFNFFVIYISCPCELHDVSAGDVPVSEGVRPQQTVGAGLQDVTFVVGQVFAKCGGKSRDGCVYFPKGTPVKEVVSPS